MQTYFIQKAIVYFYVNKEPISFLINIYIAFLSKLFLVLFKLLLKEISTFDGTTFHNVYYFPVK